MGEVYRARDTKLGRDVTLEVRGPPHRQRDRGDPRGLSRAGDRPLRPREWGSPGSPHPCDHHGLVVGLLPGAEAVDLREDRVEQLSQAVVSVSFDRVGQPPARGMPAGRSPRGAALTGSSCRTASLGPCRAASTGGLCST